MVYSESGTVVVVESVGQLFPLASGERLVFGRDRDCTIRLAHRPPDTQVSRIAGALSLLPTTVLVHNLSETQPLYVQARCSPERTVEPRSATTALPHRAFAVILLGAHDRRYVLNVDATALPADTAAEQTGGAETTPAGLDLRLTPAQRRVLRALCEPLQQGRPEPATYAQIGEELVLQQGYVRNVLKQVRETLVGHGVPGMQADDADRSPDLRLALAQWAIRSGALD